MAQSHFVSGVGSQDWGLPESGDEDDYASGLRCYDDCTAASQHDVEVAS